MFQKKKDRLWRNKLLFFNVTRSSTDAGKIRATRLQVNQDHQTVAFHMLGI